MKEMFFLVVFIGPLVFLPVTLAYRQASGRRRSDDASVRVKGKKRQRISPPRPVFDRRSKRLA